MKFWLSALILCVCSFVCWSVARFVNYMSFEIGCGGHLRRAANANSVELALSELEQAIQYAENNNLTHGSTHLLFARPDLDISFWYKNISSARDDLKAIPSDASRMDKTNTLMKLSETLLDQGEKSPRITVPAGISIYPMNWFFAIWGWLSFIGTLVCVVFLVVLLTEMPLL